MLIWWKGKFLHANDFSLDYEMFDEISKGLAYETLRTYNRIPFAAYKHYKRLERSVSFFNIALSFKFEEFLGILKEGVRHFDCESRIRVYVSVDSGEAFFVFSPLKIPNVEMGVDTKIASVRRIPTLSTPPNLKITGRTDIVLARREIKDCYDVILLGVNGEVCEGSFSNIFLVKEGRLITPSIETGILDGITRENVIKLADTLEIPVEERTVWVWELFEADEVFLTHTRVGIVPVRRLNEHLFFEEEPGPVSTTLMENFEPFVLNLEENWVGI
ncbi:aminotransferase class IV [Thermotoga sp. KOL6]|uniref:aminotransferase class IV n=1 Tax=Thermotoga sp. KOL6 TaxID=126741 RepID=UPI000C75BC41|nr:aminotransferase class IV [Thermotoga sp. KOL6]PLV58316.1 branched-chain amino acid aminotransferase [Thermotoga sp. KOL6]